MGVGIVNSDINLMVLLNSLRWISAGGSGRGENGFIHISQLQNGYLVPTTLQEALIDEHTDALPVSLASLRFPTFTLVLSELSTYPVCVVPILSQAQLGLKAFISSQTPTTQIHVDSLGDCLIVLWLVHVPEKNLATSQKFRVYSKLQHIVGTRGCCLQPVTSLCW